MCVLKAENLHRAAIGLANLHDPLNDVGGVPWKSNHLQGYQNLVTSVAMTTVIHRLCQDNTRGVRTLPNLSKETRINFL